MTGQSPLDADGNKNITFQIDSAIAGSWVQEQHSMIHKGDFFILGNNLSHQAIFAFLLTMIFPSQAYADCRAMWHISPNVTVEPIIVPKNAPIGTLLGSGSYSYSSKLLENNGGADGTAVATGLGIQMLNKGAPFPLGEVINLLDNTNVGNVETPLTARNYQTGEKITPGAANAVASFTLIYQ
ncbi:fimbrial protein [Yersinia nurmii]|nr:fimbrial protein [Yersinia nurmii]